MNLDKNSVLFISSNENGKLNFDKSVENITLQSTQNINEDLVFFDMYTPLFLLAFISNIIAYLKYKNINY